MWTAQSVADLRLLRRSLKGTVAFVPTMGALHAGHLSLVQAGRQLADHVIVSIYVNPTQFAPHEDFNRYPRPLADDLTMCLQAGATGVFNPTNEEMYPPNQLECFTLVPALDTILEGEFRPGHFAGVCRVVAKLFNMVQPDIACLGRKDYQQLKVLEAMTEDLAMPIRIVGCPTLRDADGMAMSSRNRYLTPETRKRGLGLFKALSEARAMVEERGETDPAAVEAAMYTILTAHKLATQYAVVRHPRTLTKIDCIEPALTGGVVALIACKVDEVRLIDNMVLGES
jgi:pantoate--beta-alanine ligase